MRIAVVGAGGVGGYFGGRLAQAGHDVLFVARGRQLDALQRDGLRLESIAGNAHLTGVVATHDPTTRDPVEAVLLGVKAWQVSSAARLIAPLVSRDTIVVPLQNGVDAPDDIAAVLGAGSAAGGLCWIVSELVEPGHVRHLAADPTVLLGELDNRRTTRIEGLRAALDGSPGIRATIAEDIRFEMWRKFLFIAAVSGVGSITRLSVGEWREEPEARDLVRGALAEIDRLAFAVGVTLGEERIQEALRFLDRLAPDSTPSMQRDLMNGRASELEYQTGAVVRLAEAAGVDVPINRLVLAGLLPLERRARRSGRG